MPPRTNSSNVSASAPTTTTTPPSTSEAPSAPPDEKKPAAPAAPPAITLENTFSLALSTLKSALQQLIALKVPETAPVRLDAENAFEAVRVATEQRRYELPTLAKASEALTGPVSFLNNHSSANETLVKTLSANAGVIAKRIVFLTPKAEAPKE